MSVLRSVPPLGTGGTRVLDARATGAVAAMFSVVGLPWTWIQPSPLNVGTSAVAFVVGLVLLIRPPGLPGWALAGTTALTGVVAAYLTLVVHAMSLAAALSLCVVLQVSALRHRAQAWTQLWLIVGIWGAALLVASVPEAVLRSMVPLVAALVLLTAITTWTRCYVDELLVQLHHRADHDLLTGLSNRQGLARRLEELGLVERRGRRATDAPAESPLPGSVVGAGRHAPRPAAPVAPARSAGAAPVRSSSEVAAGEPTGVLVIDVDHFKAVNDQHGHLVGDEVLTWLAAQLRGALPAPVLLARFGGEEFLAVVPGVDLGALVRCAERLRVLVATASTSGPVALTVSIGAAAGNIGTVRSRGLETVTFEDLVARADRGVYAAKASGRNQVSCGPGPANPTPARG
ncbi:diguanylate cyclase (GGDEF)-like protein [Kineococcus radiotolerans]|uniref:Diguanylate cyclase (GGDEF)-like protein n=1 Tax=Kineococcus radiotolerans TaxID=131568 RepID=A0A7W4TIR2_KINRA|nr:GGDEF domain-containing protein [Kineococcus radiotolerans]MBB2899217.1 diguanylate cyclase (GGDEF)-like protein [Kineococcus radiotolerans]